MYRINIALTRHIVVIVLVLQYRLKKILCFKKKKKQPLFYNKRQQFQVFSLLIYRIEYIFTYQIIQICITVDLLVTEYWVSISQEYG